MTRALLMGQDLALTVAEQPPVVSGPGDVVVQVAWAGVCGSDLHVMRTGDWVEYWPATLGHEVAGWIVASQAPGWDEGTPVVVDSRIPCGVCDGCRRSARLCTAMAWLGERRPGGYADRLTVPAHMVHPVPAGLDLSVAVLAEPLAVAMSALDRVHQPPRSVLTVGYGPIGAFCHTEVTRRWPEAAVSVVEPSPARSRLAAARQVPVAAALSDLPGTDAGPPGFDLVIDAAGYPGSLSDALSSVTSGGTVLLVALSSKPTPVTPSAIVERSVGIAGSVGFDTGHLHRALDALAADPDRYSTLVTHRVPLAGLPAFLAEGVQRTAGKVIVSCDPHPPARPHTQRTPSAERPEALT
ncbi:zinc-dependent alcohol dehydrogenase [Streptomyces shenzhenensis]|uniref:zinc-dependent alcohol dehydrogenase n=1 Tax=Streptomyces shenzhenensis TaxID=943815 RepID=UPI003D8DEB99